MTHSHAIVWIDHHEARVLHFNTTEFTQTVVGAGNPHLHLHHKANTIGSGHAPVDREFHRRVGRALGDSCIFLIAGPSSAKAELTDTLTSDQPAISARIAGVETVDHPTDGELVAYARDYFRRYQRMHSSEARAR